MPARNAIKAAVIAQDKIRARNTQLFIAKLNKFLQRHIPGILALKGKDFTEAATVIGGLNSALEELGLTKAVSGIRVAYADEILAIARRFEMSDLKKAFSGADSAVVNSLIDQDYKRVTSLITPYVDDIGATMLRAVIAGEEPDIGSLIDRATDLLESQVETEVNTMLGSFSRSVTANKAAEFGLTLFLYMGPDDKITRDFCRDVLSERDPPIYSIEEIMAMDNEQTSSVLNDGGGYNCRHSWNPLAEEDAIAMGWKE